MHYAMSDGSPTWDNNGGANYYARVKILGAGLAMGELNGPEGGCACVGLRPDQ